MHYVVGDLHGYLDEFFCLRDKILERDPDAEFILTGDLIDRGPKVFETLEWAMKNVNNGGRYRSVLGNHEHMVMSWYDNQYLRWLDLYQYYDDKYSLFPRTRYDFADVLLKEKRTYLGYVKKVMEFFEDMPITIRLSVVNESGIRMNYAIAHAWYPDLSRQDFKSQEDVTHYAVWERDDAMWGHEGDDYVVVHGHTPTIEREFFEEYDKEPFNAGLIAYRKNAINVDGGIPYREYLGRFATVCAICLETLEEFFADEIPADYPYMENRYQKELKKRIRGDL